MKKYILILLVLFFGVVIYLSFVEEKDDTVDKDLYLSKIANIENELDDLSKEIESLQAEEEFLDMTYNQLKDQHSSKMTKEDMYDWFNQCNNYNVRANMKLETKYYNTFLGVETSSSTTTGNAVIFSESGNTKYVLTSYFNVNEKDYDKVKYTLYDAFQNKYTAQLQYRSQKYGLAILVFNDTKVNDLYCISLANSTPKEGDPICNIYSFKNSTYNHMNFSKIEKYEYNKEYFNFQLIVNEIDTISSIYGCMSVNQNGELIGIVALTNSNYCKSIPLAKIKEFLKSCNITV